MALCHRRHDNQEYMILKSLAEGGGLSGIPGLDVPGVDMVAVAEGYGVPSRTAGDPEETRHALREAIAADDGPRLVHVRVASGMWRE